MAIHPKIKSCNDKVYFIRYRTSESAIQQEQKYGGKNEYRIFGLNVAVFDILFLFFIGAFYKTARLIYDHFFTNIDPNCAYLRQSFVSHSILWWEGWTCRPLAHILQSQCAYAIVTRHFRRARPYKYSMSATHTIFLLILQLEIKRKITISRGRGGDGGGAGHTTVRLKNRKIR